jgi:hypothetical protein
MKRILLCSLFVSFVGSGAYAVGCPYDVRGGSLTACGYIGASGSAAGGCTAAQVTAHETCTKTGASVAECISNGGANSCAALECDGDHLLYTTLRNNAGVRRKEIEVVDTKLSDFKDLYVGEKVGSQGLCRSRQELETLCSNSCACDNSGEKCVLNEVTVRNRKKYGESGKQDVQAFIGEEVCICVPKSCDERYTEPEAVQCCELKDKGLNVDWNEELKKCECVGEDAGKILDLENEQCVDEQQSDDGQGEWRNCVYEFKASAHCSGKIVEMYKKEPFLVPVTKQDAEKIGAKKCEDFKKSADAFKDLNNKYKQEFDELVKKWCAKVTVSGDNGNNNNDAEIQAAKQSLDAFMTTALNNRNVWKNKDGQFNTSRLASDLTAGVVLGTVGGIVSANVIKKKQIEKGFDALHCTVGGQKVADWGDQFNVGFRRY